METTKTTEHTPVITPAEAITANKPKEVLYLSFDSTKLISIDKKYMLKLGVRDKRPRFIATELDNDNNKDKKLVEKQTIVPFNLKEFKEFIAGVNLLHTEVFTGEEDVCIINTSNYPVYDANGKPTDKTEVKSGIKYELTVDGDVYIHIANKTDWIAKFKVITENKFNVLQYNGKPIEKTSIIYGTLCRRLGLNYFNDGLKLVIDNCENVRSSVHQLTLN